MPRALVVLVILFSLAAHAEDLPYLVRDLPGFAVTDSIGYRHTFWTTVGNTTWFVAHTSSTQVDIFKSDGTAAGTARVTYGEGAPTASRAGSFLGVIGGKLIYGGSDAGGEGLFALDTAGGAPVLLARASTADSIPGVMRGGFLYFPAAAGNPLNLWRTDGTPAGTTLVDIASGEQGALTLSSHKNLHVIGDWIYFFGVTAQGSGLHRTDGTAANTTLLLPLSAEDLANDVGDVTVFGQRLLFYLRWDGGDRPSALWATDGTAAGTGVVAEVQTFQPMAVLGGRLLFAEHGSIWTTDGTPAGTQRTNIVGDDAGSVYSGGVIGDDFYFFAGGLETTLFVTRGSAETTRAIMTVDHGNTVGHGDGFVLGNHFYFRHDDGIHGMELWRTDGTITGLVADVNPGYRDGIDSFDVAVRPDGTVFFPGMHYETGREPWITNGTAAGTRLLANLASDGGVHGSSPHRLRATGDLVFFMADPYDGENSIGVSDGTRTGTSTTLIDNPFIVGYAAAGGRYFLRSGETDPFGLYASDGTLGGTIGIHPEPATPYAFREGVLFAGQDAVWFSNGTIAGTHTVLNAVDAFAGVRILPTGDRAWLASRFHVWTTDGTAAGTTEVMPPAGGWGGGVYEATRLGAADYLFQFSDGSSEARLLRSDRTTAAPTVVKALTSNSQLPELVGRSERFFWFTMERMLHRSDGTSEGTIALPAPDPCIASGAALGDALVFTTFTSSRLSVWRSDGTAEGTTKLVTMEVRNVSRFPPCVQVVALGDRVYFPGYDATHGWEPWVSDGTVAGTKLLADLFPGRTSSDPDELTAAGERLFFSAEAPNKGRELWAIGDAPPVTRRRAVGRR
ncbi:MAG TPA: hypothetical protein VE974_04485 [Thermoanaerobaculia bacterium]|nr:hypothetical protein [Thermoanaerobaculia bacterium]